jgi:hypothetical protein
MIEITVSADHQMLNKNEFPHQLQHQFFSMVNKKAAISPSHSTASQ